MAKLYGFIMLIALLPMAVQAQQEVSIDTPIALVDDTPITFHDLSMAEDEIFGMVGELPVQQRQQALLGFLVNRELAAKAAISAGMNTEDPEVAKRIAFYTKKALQEVYVGRMMAERVSDQDVRTYYDKEVAGAAPVEEVRARHILLADEKLAREVARQAQQKDADFEALAKQYSTGPSGPSGGDLGYFSAEQMVPEFSDASFKMKAGEVSDPVKSQFGWHIIKLEDRRTRPVPTFEQIEMQITEHLIGEAQREVYDQMRDAAKVEMVMQNAAPSEPAGAGQ